ncbi:MAG: mannitol-1-phosphate 5-dehydrogenase [Sporolactobacillus sp.]
MKKVIHFGAGNIGRGFIGALFEQSGYEVIFVDIAAEIINHLNTEHTYYVRTASEPEHVYSITHFSGINNQLNPEKVIKAINEVEFITTAIGPNVLPYIAPLIARGLKARTTNDNLYVIACENQINATDSLEKEILKHIDSKQVEEILAHVFFLNSAVDRIVPVQHNTSPLDVLVEDYHEWIVETSVSIPTITGMQTVPALSPYIERKLFTVNTGHAVTAYLGYLAGKQKIHEALRDPIIFERVKETLEETGAYLIKKHHFDSAVHEQYIEKIIHRFQNPKLNDDVTRVGRAPLRKLGGADRLIRPAVEAYRLGLPYQHLTEAIAACLHFDYQSDSEAVSLQRQIQEQGVSNALAAISGLPENHPIVQAAISAFYKMEKVEH